VSIVLRWRFRLTELDWWKNLMKSGIEIQVESVNESEASFEDEGMLSIVLEEKSTPSDQKKRSVDLSNKNEWPFHYPTACTKNRGATHRDKTSCSYRVVHALRENEIATKAQFFVILYY
jgi:hypothetical protein